MVETIPENIASEDCLRGPPQMEHESFEDNDRFD